MIKEWKLNKIIQIQQVKATKQKQNKQPENKPSFEEFLFRALANVKESDVYDKL